MSQVIGKYNEEDLAAIDQPGTAWYLPYPDTSMSCSQLNAGIAAAANFIAYWQSALAKAQNTLIPSGRRINAILQILKNLRGKETSYKALLFTCDQVQQPFPSVPIEEVQPPAGSSSSGLWWLVAAAAGIYIIKKNRSNGR